MSQDIDESDEASGAGSASLAGYEYQIDVSVWLALDLVLVTGRTDALTLEPASQEDLEATVADTEPGCVVSRASIDDYTLTVQAKRHGGDAWTPTKLKALLKHGSDTRISAAERLKTASARYLLVTSASVNGDARKLRRRQPGSWPKPAAMPHVIANGIAHDISGRVAVIANQDDERLRGDIDRLLTEGCRVPNSRLHACRTRLREDARARIAGAGAGRWRRSEIEAVIREHEGYLASAPELEHYVHPNNWSDLRAAMAKESGAIIIGQSGTGKTLATKKLYEELHAANPGLTRVPISLGPSQLANDTTPRPVLFDIEDPWGRFDFDPRSRPWNTQLADFLAAARPDAMIIATSRLDVASESKALNTVKSWIVNLEAENYGKAERQRLYRTRIDSLPRELQPLARGAERKVLDKLATPYEIQKFFDAMRTQDREGLKNPPGFVAGAIDAAHVSSIEQTVIDQIEQRCDVRAAAVLYALLIASDKVTRGVLREIEDGLADRNVALERGLSPLVDFFVAARNLRQGDGGIITYYHPRVEAGITRTIEKSEHRQAVRSVLRHLVELLVSDEGPGAAWGAGAAARILGRLRDKFGVKPGEAAWCNIDTWLEARLAEGGKNFEANLELAARAGSPVSNQAELARFLLHRPDRSFAGLDSWGRPDHPGAWYQGRADDPSTKPLLETFIRTVLPRDRTMYPASFAADLRRLSGELTPAFLAAAAQAVHYGYISSDDAIAAGALDDLEGFEAVVDTAIEVLTPSAKELADVAELRLDIANDVYSDDYAQHLSENDDGHTAGEFLEGYVSRVRQEKGWQRLAEHRHAERLRSYWLRELAKQTRDAAIDPEELTGAFQAGFGTDDEDNIWYILAKRWDDRYAPQLGTRVAEGSPQELAEQAALACAVEHLEGSWSAIVAGLAEKQAHNRLIEIARGLAYLRSGKSLDGDKHVEAAEAVAAQLPAPYGEICDAALALRTKEAPVLSAAAQDLLAGVSDPTDDVRAFRLALDAQIALPVEDDVRWALTTSSAARTAIDGIHAAIRHGMSSEIEVAIGHRFAHVTAPALTAFASPLEAPLPKRLLDLAAHRASPVRRGLVDLLKYKSSAEHQSTLIKLAGDQWSRHSQTYGSDSDDYPIAQTAIGALADIAPLGAADDDALYTIAIDSSDPDVRSAILDLLAKTAGVAIQTRIFDLAVEPGRARVRKSAAYALLHAGSALDQGLIDAVTPQLIATRYEPVAAVFALLLGWRGQIDAIRSTAEEIAPHAKRRVLLLLTVWTLADRDHGIAEEIAAMLPAGHTAVEWALGGTLDKVDDDMIADLGEHAVCAEVLKYMRIKSTEPDA